MKSSDGDEVSINTEEHTQIQYLDHLPDKFRDSAVDLYLDALGDYLMPILGNDNRAHKILVENLDTNRCIAAICNQKLVGILGIQTNKGSFLNPTLKAMIETYGILGGIFRMCGLALLHYSTGPDEFYVDGVIVADEMRSKGIGSRLFGILERTALKKRIQRISLGVVDTNPRAKALYKRLRFIETRKIPLWPFTRIFRFPFASVTMMTKTIG